jgi:hypothetical protein
MLLKIDRINKTLIAMLETGEIMTFNLSRKAYVFEDTVEVNSIILDYRHDIVVFKVRKYFFVSKRDEVMLLFCIVLDNG